MKIPRLWLCAILTAGTTMMIAVDHAGAQSCPCDFAASVKARTLRGTIMGCGFRDNLVTHEIDFSAIKIKKNGGLAKRWDYSVSEDAPESPFSSDPACQINVTRGSKGGNKTVSKLTIFISAAEADACATDLSAFAFGQLTQKGADSPQAPCEDNDGNGVIDSWEFF